MSFIRKLKSITRKIEGNLTKGLKTTSGKLNALYCVGAVASLVALRQSAKNAGLLENRGLMRLARDVTKKASSGVALTPAEAHFNKQSAIIALSLSLVRLAATIAKA
mgnify:CR=1 FL=1